MTSRELVRKALTFSSPARVPRQLWLLEWANLHYPEQVTRIRGRFPDDIINAPAFYKEPLKTTGDSFKPGIFVDEWGCVFENRQPGVIGEVKEPVLKEWRDWESVRIPRERLSADAGRIADFCRASDRFVISSCAVRPFEQLQFIRGSVNLYMDIADSPPEFFKLLGRMHQFYCEELELWASAGVDALAFSDDWGSQKSLLISPAIWRKFFKPLYKDYIDIAHRRGKSIFMHSDGYILDILPDFVDLGLEAINSQLFCMDIEELGRRFAGKITFWGEIDRQRLLPFGTPDDVKSAVRLVRRSLERDGGVIAQCEFGAGARPENIEAVFEAWEEEPER